jgi:hypothetical protein
MKASDGISRTAGAAVFATGAVEQPETQITSERAGNKNQRPFQNK